MKKDSFTVQFKNTKLVGDIIPESFKPSVLILHGSGKSNRLRYDYIRFPLAQDGIATCTFDFIGHGETGGDVTSTSLRERTQQVAAVIDQLKMSQPLGLIGGSMGAYTAIKLTELYQVNCLVLIVPAVYRKEAYKLPFGEEFSNIIREEKSWDDTDAWDIISNYRGKLLIVVAGRDEIVPNEVSKRLYNSAAKAKTRRIYIVKNAPHKIREYLTNPANKVVFQEFYDLVRQFLTKT